MANVLFLKKLLYSLPIPEIKNNLGSFEITDSLFIHFVISFRTNVKVTFSRNRLAHKVFEIVMTWTWETDDAPFCNLYYFLMTVGIMLFIWVWIKY